MKWAIFLLAAAAAAQEQQCQGCHPAEARAFARTGMAKSMAVPKPADAEFLRGAKVGQYSSVVRDGRVYHESALESHQVLYAIGSGRHGKSYVIARGDALFLSPLSYYSAAAAWDFSPGFARGPFRDFMRPVAADCLFCHAGREREAISCERCHGPGEQHVKSPAAHNIVNPAKLNGDIRDDVCYQCHLGGDIRILRRGKTERDFRAGMRLADVMAVFSIPAIAKPEGLDAVGQAVQLRMSRCSKESQGKLRCTTCHNPHGEPEPARATAWYSSRCQQCHRDRPCTGPAGPDCVACHMPQNQLNRVSHIAHTNHRILRFKEDALDPSAAEAQGSDLVYEGPGQPDLRSKALAYAEAAAGLPVLRGPAVRLLEQAANTYPDDAGLAGALGLALRTGTRAGLFLERAVALGSKSPEIREALAELLAGRGESERALQFLREIIPVAPYDAAPALTLARLCLRFGKRDEAAALVQKVRSFDPGNPALPELERQVGAEH